LDLQLGRSVISKSEKESVNWEEKETASYYQ